MSISRLAIGKKIAGGFLMVLMVALSVGIFGLWTTDRTAGRLQIVSTELLPETALANQIEREILNARIHFIYFVTIQKPGSLDQGWRRFRTAQEELPKLQELVKRSDVLADMRPDVAQLRRDFDSYQPVLTRIIEVVQNKQNKGPEFDALIKEWARLGGAMVDSAGRLAHRGSVATGASMGETTEQLHRADTMLASACFGALLLGAILAFFVSRDVARALRSVIEELADSAHHVAGAAAQISSSSQSVAEGASQQAASLEETSASSEEVNAMARRNGQHAKLAADTMTEASARVDEANRHLDEMVVSMREINASGNKISKIIKVIDEIAFQTNILALNAAVEAARAGQAGLGFAVVADEVRNLAHRCSQAAKDTAELIEESVGKSNRGKATLDRVGEAVCSMMESAAKVKTLVDEVKAGSEEQARGIGLVANSIGQMQNVTQATAANAEESASASAELSGQAKTLRSIVGRLAVMVDGN